MASPTWRLGNELEDPYGGESPKSVLYKSSQTCKLHARDFSDCLRYHKQHPFWDVFYSQLPVDKHNSPRKLGTTEATRTTRTLSTSTTAYGPATPRMDPFKFLGLDVMQMVLALLDAPSLARCGMTSKEWRSVAHSDLLWESKCAELWTGKGYVPAEGLSKFAAYSMSIRDSQRVLITVDDLSQNTWEFRFKKSAPEYWLELDPSSRGETPMRRFFHPDGSQTAPPGDPVWGGHESSYSIIENSSGDSKQVERYVRINHWPKMTVSRTPDWGWELSNDFYVYKSLPKTQS